MAFPHSSRLWFPFLMFALVRLSAAAPARAESWDPVAPEDRQGTRARVDNTADVEALFWKIRVEDAWNGSSIYSDLSQYLRVQVFNDRGAAARQTVSIAYDSKSKIIDLQARMVRPDGTAKEIDKKTVFERTLLKTGRRKVKEKTFAVPDLKPGCIVEYRWTERRYDRIAHYLRLDLQKEFPVRVIDLALNPLIVPGSGFEFRLSSFHGPTPMFEDASGGWHKATLRDVPAFRTEPRMPPEDAVRHWIVLQYKSVAEPPPGLAWKDYGKTTAEVWHGQLQPNGEVKKAASDAIAGAADDMEKARRLVALCRARVRNLQEDAIGTPPAPDDLEDSKNPGTTLQRGMGSPFDIQCLFVAFCSAAGLQSRIALLPDPDQTFDDGMFTPYFLTGSCAAIWIDGGWRFFDPTNRYSPNGSLRSDQEGRLALIADREGGTFVRTPVAPPAFSEGRRRGVFQLASDGTLEGDVTATYAGHWGESMREDDDDVSPEQREKNFLEVLRRRISAAEVKDLRFEHALDGDGPYVVSYHLRVPGYAARVGKRLLLGPAVFENGRVPDFTSAERRYPVWFTYPWSEDDSVAIHLPEGYTAETLPTLQPILLPDLGGYSGMFATSLDGTTLLFRRQFEFGRNGTLNFPASEYPALKKAFDSISERDGTAISLTTAGSGRP